MLAGGRAVAHRSCSLSLGTAAGGEEKNSDTAIQYQKGCEGKHARRFQCVKGGRQVT